MKPNVEKYEYGATDGPRDITLRCLSENHIVQKTAPDAPLHLTVTFFSTVGQITECLLEASRYFTLLLSVVLDVIIARISLLDWTSSDD